MKRKPPVIEIDVDDVTPAGMRAAMIWRFGPRCAGWLVNRFRRQIRVRGFFLVHGKVDPNEAPPWFQIAIGYLEKHRSVRWRVESEVRAGARWYRVTRRASEIPIVIRPAN